MYAFCLGASVYSKVYQKVRTKIKDFVVNNGYFEANSVSPVPLPDVLVGKAAVDFPQLRYR